MKLFTLANLCTIFSAELPIHFLYFVILLNPGGNKKVTHKPAGIKGLRNIHLWYLYLWYGSMVLCFPKYQVDN